MIYPRFGWLRILIRDCHKRLRNQICQPCHKCRQGDFLPFSYEVLPATEDSYLLNKKLPSENSHCSFGQPLRSAREARIQKMSRYLLSFQFYVFHESGSSGHVRRGRQIMQIGRRDSMGRHAASDWFEPLFSTTISPDLTSVTNGMWPGKMPMSPEVVGMTTEST